MYILFKIVQLFKKEYYMCHTLLNGFYECVLWFRVKIAVSCNLWKFDDFLKKQKS